MEELIKVLQEVRDDVDFANDQELITGRALASLDILQIVSALNEAYDITIPAKEILPENFNSAAQIYAMVQRLMEE